jgi:hypothetical protein
VAGGPGVRGAWAHGANYDRSQLEFYTADPGFIIGESLLGVDPLGGAGDDELMPADFTSLSISSPTTVEDGLFVHREVETCQLSATLPDQVALQGRWVVVNYAGTELYRGRVAEVSWDEQVEVDAAYKPGNTAVKTYRVALLATSGEEKLQGMATPGQEFTSETLAQRIASWTSLTVTTQTPASDIPVNWMNAGWDTAIVRKIYRATDRVGSLLDTLRAEARLRNMTFKYQPLFTQQFILKPNNQWLVGTGATSLCFTDDPAHALGQATDPGDAYSHIGRYVGYSRRQIGQDSSLFTNAVTVTWGQYDVESPPVDDQPVPVSFGPYRASGANARDAVVDLGTIDVASAGGQNPYRLSRAVAGILPLQAKSRLFTKSVDTPLQSIQQLQGTIPGMALLESDGELERVAVLGREHVVTPDKWLIKYTLGPKHLLDRSSDFDPGTPQALPLAAGPGGGQTTFQWYVPDYPTDVTIYEVHYVEPAASNILVTSDQTLIGTSTYFVAPAPGTLKTIISSGGSGNDHWVLYTSNPAVATDNPSAAWREGQPAFLGTAL